LKIDLIAGARPNFIKIAPIIDAIHKAQSEEINITYRLIHTGQHYDKNMSDSFFEQLGIPEPNVNLGAGGGSQAEQTASIMIGYEKLLLTDRSDLCLVVGDVTSTMACSIVAQKLHVPVAHVEAGIRSNDWTMPEEINRLVTDSITNYFFTTTLEAGQNLVESGVNKDKIHWVGNTMIDTLVHFEPQIAKSSILQKLGIEEKPYILVTLHRPSNVDSTEGQAKIMRLFEELSKKYTIVFPIHPRTRKNFEQSNKVAEWKANGNLHLLDPLGYFDFQALVKDAKLILTDSGGIQEESTFRQVPCLTLRENTERPITVDLGTNTLVPFDEQLILSLIADIHEGNYKKGAIPPLWDGNATERILGIISKMLK
jgi:UDP-N-acetylglucosamine 2-epimerase (non-hydrolysing)